MSKICFFEMKAVIVSFRLIKSICDLTFKFFDHYFIVFEPLKTSCNSTFNAFKATKITQIGVEMSKICSSEVKGVII